MSVLTQYAPAEHALDALRTYTFDFQAVEENDIEVWEIIEVDSVDYRYKVPVGDYYIEWDTVYVKNPVKDSGRVIFTRNHSVGTKLVRIERNTYIDQTTILPEHAYRFSARAVVLMMDKATLIAQEIAERKCDVTMTTVIEQLVEGSEFDDFTAATLNGMVNKLYTILQEIRDTGEDCKGKGEDT